MSLASSKYGLGVSVAPSQEPLTGIGNGAVTTAGGHGRGKFLHPDSPELWLFGIGAVTLGLISVATSAHVGPLHFSAGIGK